MMMMITVIIMRAALQAAEESPLPSLRLHLHSSVIFMLH